MKMMMIMMMMLMTMNENDDDDDEMMMMMTMMMDEKMMMMMMKMSSAVVGLSIFFAFCISSTSRSCDILKSLACPTIVLPRLLKSSACRSHHVLLFAHKTPI